MISTSVLADEYRPYVNVKSITYSQPIAINSLINEWQSPFKGGANAITFNKAEAGVRWNNWQLGIFERYDYLLDFSSQTAELIYRTENHLPLEVGKDYDLRIKAQQHSSRGLRLGYKHKFTSSLYAGLAVSYLQGKTLTDGSIRGSAHVTAEKDYDFQFDADYFYSRDVLFSRDVNQPKGRGYSIDFNIDWKINKRLSTKLNIIDLVGKIYWSDAPYTVATATSATKTYDADGYVRYSPTISGYESNKSFSQTLPRKIFFSSEYKWSKNFSLLAELQDFKIVYFTSLGGGWCYSSNRCFQGLYNTTAEGVSLRYLEGGLRAELACDKIELSQARYFAFSLAFNQDF